MISIWLYDGLVFLDHPSLSIYIHLKCMASNEFIEDEIREESIELEINESDIDRFLEMLDLEAYYAD